jgi:Flp pilus assembly protein TadD
LISGLYATGGTDEAAVLLEEYRDMFPRSGRPALIDAANAITIGDFATARAHLAEARERAQKEGDTEALTKIARISDLTPDPDAPRG